MLAPPGHPTKGNVVIRLHGKGFGKPVLFIGHLDVVEVDAKAWNSDPFRLTERDGYFYGRGTEDMKGEDAVLLTALIRLRQEGFVPDRDVIVAFTADEEAGRRCRRRGVPLRPQTRPGRCRSGAERGRHRRPAP